MLLCIHCHRWLGLDPPNRLACRPCIDRWQALARAAIHFPTGGPWGLPGYGLRWPTRRELEEAMTIEFGSDWR